MGQLFPPLTFSKVVDSRVKHREARVFCRPAGKKVFQLVPIVLKTRSDKKTNIFAKSKKKSQNKKKEISTTQLVKIQPIQNCDWEC